MQMCMEYINKEGAQCRPVFCQAILRGCAGKRHSSHEARISDYRSQQLHGSDIQSCEIWQPSLKSYLVMAAGNQKWSTCWQSVGVWLYFLKSSEACGSTEDVLVLNDTKGSFPWFISPYKGHRTSVPAIAALYDKPQLRTVYRDLTYACHLITFTALTVCTCQSNINYLARCGFHERKKTTWQPISTSQ